jgi:lipopolysaccharide export system permease protein
MRLDILDRYVLGGWLRIFGLTALGFPIVSLLIELTDNIRRLLDRGIGSKAILLSLVYGLPGEISTVMPAAVLFATVFTIGTLGRHSEIIAAKAGGRSFYRLVAPIIVASALAVLLAFTVGEVAVGAEARKLELQKAREARPTAYRYNFVYRADANWIYTIRTLDVAKRVLREPVLLREGNGANYPDLSVSADSATYGSAARVWRLWDGASRIIFRGNQQPVFEFERLRLGALTQTPAQLLAEAKAPAEMRFGELGEYIEALQRSGNDVRKLQVEHALKLAIPFTCLIIALFGAPLSVTSPRAGTAVGVALSLGTTVVFLLLINLSKAVGAGGSVNPVVAAWFPNVLFLSGALLLMQKVRT